MNNECVLNCPGGLATTIVTGLVIRDVRGIQIHKYAGYNTRWGEKPRQQVVSASYTKQYRGTEYNMYVVRRYHVPGGILGN